MLVTLYPSILLGITKAVSVQVPMRVIVQVVPSEFLLLFNHRIEASDGIALESRHRSASVQNKYEFSNVVFHNRKPPFVLLCLHYSTHKERFGRIASDKLFA